MESSAALLVEGPSADMEKMSQIAPTAPSSSISILGTWAISTCPLPPPPLELEVQEEAPGAVPAAPWLFSSPCRAASVIRIGEKEQIVLQRGILQPPQRRFEDFSSKNTIGPLKLAQFRSSCPRCKQLVLKLSFMI